MLAVRRLGRAVDAKRGPGSVEHPGPGSVTQKRERLVEVDLDIERGNDLGKTRFGLPVPAPRPPDRVADRRAAWIGTDEFAPLAHARP